MEWNFGFFSILIAHKTNPLEAILSFSAYTKWESDQKHSPTPLKVSHFINAYPTRYPSL